MTLGFSEQQLTSFLDQGPTGAIAQDQEPELELVQVSNNIALQYLETLTQFAGEAFSARSLESVRNVTFAIDALRRLAVAAGNEVQLGLLDELREMLWLYQEMQKRNRGRERFVTGLRRWVPRFGETLSASQRDSFVELVRYNKRSAPLLGELGKIRGIGKSRLERLYCAGLFDVEVVAQAAPEEIAQVTGIPRALCGNIVTASNAYADHLAWRCIDQLTECLGEFANLATRNLSDFRLQQAVDNTRSLLVTMARALEER